MAPLDQEEPDEWTDDKLDVNHPDNQEFFDDYREYPIEDGPYSYPGFPI